MLAVRPDELDTDPYLLNFENGTVDLRRGDLGPALRRDRITKLIRYDYVQSSRSEVFDKFIARTFGQRVESGEWEAGGLAEFIRMSMGYSATGLTREKTTFLIWGPTDTGKSTFLTLMRDLLAEYATLIFADTLMASKRGSEDSNARADLADLRGCRLAITSETEEGQRLKESTIKRLTQGQGLYKSVRKYENPIEFRETHKLWVDTNHQPIVRGTGDDTWNRLAPIPCENRLKEAEIDRELPKKLREKPAAEAALAWIVRGAGDYLESGLTRPEPVTEARKKWRAEMDTAGTFIEENCVVEKGASAGAKDIYTRYKFWAEGRNEAAMSMTMFGRRLSERGFEKSDGKKGPVVYYGICLDTTR